MFDPSARQSTTQQGGTPGASGYPAGLRINASSTDTLQYLGAKVGSVLEARVINVVKSKVVNVVEAIAVDAKSAKTTVDSTAGSTPPATKADRQPIGTNSNNNQQGYRIELAVGNTRLQVEASLAPRVGQLLQLEVLSAKQMRLVDNPQQSTSAASSAGDRQVALNAPSIRTAAQTPDANTVSSSRPASAATTLTSPGNQVSPAIALVQLALRNSLPKQLSRAELGTGLAALSNRQIAVGTSIEQPLRGNVSRTLAADTQTTVNIHTKPAVKNQSDAGFTPADPSTTRLSPDIAKAVALIGQSKLTDRNTNGFLPQLAQLTTATRNSISSVGDLTTTKGVQQAVLNSGIFYEQKLFKLIHTIIQNQSTSSNESAHKLATSDSAAHQNVLAKIRSALNNDSIQRDAKFRSLSTVQAIKSLLAGEPEVSAQFNQRTYRGHDKSAALNAQTPLSALWQLEPLQQSQSPAQIAAAQQTGTSTDKEFVDSLLQLLRLSLGISARTQSQQLMALGSQFASTGDSGTPQALSMELPMWIDQRLTLVDLRIEQEAQNKSAQPHKNRVWHLRMRFDLEEYGELTALASLSGKQMNAVFWASQDSPANKINAELQALTNVLSSAGIVVQHLQCRVGCMEIDSNNSIANLLESSLLDTRI